MENYLNDSLHMYVENAPVVLINQTVPNKLPGKVYSIEANDKILDELRCPFFMIQAAQNQKQTNTGGLSKLLQFKFGNKVMLNFNIDIQDSLINCFVTESLSYRNQSIGSLCKSMDWFLYDRDLHHERVNGQVGKLLILTLFKITCEKYLSSFLTYKPV